MFGIFSFCILIVLYLRFGMYSWYYTDSLSKCVHDISSMRCKYGDETTYTCITPYRFNDTYIHERLTFTKYIPYTLNISWHDQGFTAVMKHSHAHCLTNYIGDGIFVVVIWLALYVAILDVIAYCIYFKLRI